MDHGIEADKSYYIAQRAGGARHREDEIDLTVYPPPDLMVEAVATHEPKKSLVICRELGVPEVWVYRVRRRSLEFLHLDAQGQYQAGPASRAFPFLTPADVLPWVEPTAGRVGPRPGEVASAPGSATNWRRGGVEPDVAVLEADCHKPDRCAVQARGIARLQDGTHPAVATTRSRIEPLRS